MTLLENQAMSKKTIVKSRVTFQEFIAHSGLDKPNQSGEQHIRGILFVHANSCFDFDLLKLLLQLEFTEFINDITGNSGDIDLSSMETVERYVIKEPCSKVTEEVNES